LIAFLEKEGLVQWTQRDNKKDVFTVARGAGTKQWTAEKVLEQWRSQYFDGNSGEAKVETLRNDFISDTATMKRYVIVSGGGCGEG
jgi:hypothetical protein